jgi:lysophospholipase L1-like esterase
MSQHDAAMAAITAHRTTLRAILVGLGSNDLLDGERHGATVAQMSAALTRIVTELRAAVAGVAHATGAHVADVHAAIDTSTAVPDPALCTYVDCAHGDVHPTVAGHARLAAAALAAPDAA